MEFITTGNRIAVENFDIGKIYTITWQTGNNKSLACTGKGTDFVMFQDQEPDLLFCLTMDSAITVSSIEEGGGGSGTNNYNELENKPSINGFVLVGNKTGADLGLASQSDLEDYATNASLVAGLAGKQDALSSSQLAAVNSGITSALVTQIGTNTSAISGKQDALSSSQLAAVNSGITSALVTQIGTNTSAIAGKQDALSSSQLAAVNSGITSALVTQIGTNTSAIAGKQDALSSSQLAAVNSGITSADVAQITTNKNNIFTVYGGIVEKNKLDYNLTYLKSINTAGTWTNNVYVRGNVTYTVNADNTITVSSTGAGTAPFFLKTGIYNSYGGDILSGCPANGSDATYQINVEQAAGSYSLLAQDSGQGRKIADNTQQNINIYINCKTATESPLTFKPMICSNADWTISHDYQPYTYDMATISTLLRGLINQ